MDSKNVKLLLLMFLFLGVSFPIFSEANNNEWTLKKDLIALAADFQEIPNFDQPVLSEDGKKIAWTVYKKPPETSFDPAQMKNSPAPFLYAGSKIIMKEEGCEALEISVVGGNSWGPSWSLNGNYIAYYSDIDGEINLWIYDVIHRTNRKLAEIPVGGSFFTTKAVWASNHQIIYVAAPSDAKKENPFSENTSFSHFKTEEKSSDEDLKANQLVSININDGTYCYLTENDPSSNITSFSLSPSGNRITYVTSKWNFDPSLKIHGMVSDIWVASADGKTQLSISQSLCRDFKYEIKCIWHPTLDRLYFIAEEQIWVAEFAKENLVTCKPIQEILEPVSKSTLAFSKDGQYLIVGADSQELYDYSVEHPTKLLFISLDQKKSQSYVLPEQWIFSDLILNRKETVWQPSSDCITYIATNTKDRGMKGILSLNLATGELTPLWEGRARLKVIDFDPEHQVLYVSYEDFTTNKEIFCYNYHDKSFEPISHTEKAFSNVAVGHFHLITSSILGSNGELEEVMTGIILPTGAKQGDKLPAIVVHYPGANFASQGSEFAGGDSIGGMPQWLFTNHGFVVILPNLVMGKEAVGKPLQVMTERLIPQVIQAAKLGYIDIDRVGIIGQSYGGYGTAGIISHTDIFCAAVATNGLYDLPSFSHHLDSTGRNFWMTWAEVSQGNMGVPLFDDPKRYIDNSPFYRADKIHTPLLLIHGQLDDAYTDAGKMFSALRRLNRSAEFVVYHKGWHLIGKMRRSDHIDAIERILNYFHRHLYVSGD